MEEFLINHEEEALAAGCLEHALASGADKARITLNKNLTELYGTLNGSLDKVSRSLDRAVMITIFTGGRYGSFTANRIDREHLFPFIEEAVRTVGMLAPDPLRDLPDPARTQKNAVTGRETGLLDPAFAKRTSDERLATALSSAVFGKISGKGFKLISEEGEYSDSVSDLLLLDSNGLRCRHSETSFDYGVEATVEDEGGNRISGYWWDSAPLLCDLDAASCGKTAVERAASLIGPKPVESGPRTIVVDSGCGSTLLSPILNALSGFAIQQKNSFLDGTLGKKVFPESLSILDLGEEYGKCGSRLFDIEGVAINNSAIIENGVVKEYFLNTYDSKKLGMAPTVDAPTRAVIRPAGIPEGKRAGREEIMSLCGDGILITGFNGGNSNPTTGDFSFGIEGILFSGGRPVHPVREMLMTGNLVSLWNSLLYAGDDPRKCMSRQIPTLAFANVMISA